MRKKTEEHTLNRLIPLVAWANGTQLLASLDSREYTSKRQASILDA